MWSFNYFFFNASQKKILYFTCCANSRFADTHDSAVGGGGMSLNDSMNLEDGFGSLADMGGENKSMSQGADERTSPFANGYGSAEDMDEEDLNDWEDGPDGPDTRGGVGGGGFVSDMISTS